MRTAASFVAWLVAVVAAIVTVPTLWVSTHIADEDGYVEFTTPFVSDPELRDALTAQVSDDVVSEAGLPSAVRPVVQKALSAVAGRVAEQPGFTKAWAEAQRSTHQRTFGQKGDSDRLVVDIGPVAGFVVDQVTDDLPVQVDTPDELLVPVQDAPDPEVIARVGDTPGQARIGLAVVAIAALLCLLLARRRAVALAGLGLGALLTAGVLFLGTGLAVPEVLDRTPASTPFARTMRDLLVDRATDSLDAWLVPVAIAGGVALLLGLVLRAVGGRR